MFQDFAHLKAAAAARNVTKQNTRSAAQLNST